MSEKKRRMLVASRAIAVRDEDYNFDTLDDVSAPVIFFTVEDTIRTVRALLREPDTAEIIISITPAGEGEEDE